jgi:uncharacterized membrane protein
MNEIIKVLLFAFGMFVLDLPWLIFQNSWVQEFMREIQGGRSMNPRLWAGAPVYLALGYLLTQQISAPRAFLAGLCVYAVYDFTQLFAFDKYPLSFAVIDTLWGGFLMAFSWWLANYFGLVAAEK